MLQCDYIVPVAPPPQKPAWNQSQLVHSPLPQRLWHQGWNEVLRGSVPQRWGPTGERTDIRYLISYFKYKIWIVQFCVYTSNCTQNYFKMVKTSFRHGLREKEFWVFQFMFLYRKNLTSNRQARNKSCIPDVLSVYLFHTLFVDFKCEVLVFLLFMLM